MLLVAPDDETAADVALRVMRVSESQVELAGRKTHLAELVTRRVDLRTTLSSVSAVNGIREKHQGAPRRHAGCGSPT